MNHSIHPPGTQTVYECGNCGTEIQVVSTVSAQAKLDTCSNCHPAYTGKAVKSISGSRVDAFRDRYKLAR